MLLDRANRSYLSLCSYEGGMDIEQLAVERPEALARVEVDPDSGIDLAKASEIAVAAKFPAELVDKVAPVLVKLYEVYDREDATLVEVNPLVLTGAGDILALDGKVTLDANADFRHPEHEALEDKAETRPARGARPRRTTSTTSSSTARSASSATARGSSCRPSTSSPTPARSTAA